MSKTKKLNKEHTKECITLTELAAKCDSAYMKELAAQGFSIETAFQMLYIHKAVLSNGEE